MAFDGGLVLLRSNLNNSKPVWLALDTGASVSVLDSAFAQSLGLQLAGRPRLTGAGGRVQGAYARGVHVAIGEAELQRQTFIVSPLGFLPPKDGQPVVGILGFDLFSRFVVEIDYEAREIQLHDPQAHQYQGHGAIIPVTFHTNQPYIRASLTVPGRTPLEGEYVVDLGSNNTLMLANDYAATHEMHSALVKVLKVPAAGVGGEFHLTIGRLQRLQVGPFVVEGPLALFPPGQITGRGKAGNIGGRFLRRFKVIFDYSRERMILEPTSKLTEPERFDMSGLRLAATSPPSDRLQITQVLTESPAAEAGIQKGDIVLKIDARSASAMPLGELREMFRSEEGREFDLEIQSGNTTRVVRIKLRRLI
jgi:hypothetical protein